MGGIRRIIHIAQYDETAGGSGLFFDDLGDHIGLAFAAFIIFLGTCRLNFPIVAKMALEVIVEQGEKYLFAILAQDLGFQ